MTLSDETKLNLFRSMLRIRRVQERIESEYMKDEMKTPVHLYIGQEAIAASVCAALRDDVPCDLLRFAAATYRSKDCLAGDSIISPVQSLGERL